MKKYILLVVVIMAVLGNASAVVKLKEQKVDYFTNGTPMIGYIVYDENLKTPRPAVLVIHEWWGLNDYPKKRARMLAELGYVAFCVDVYGEGKSTDLPDSAKSWSGQIYIDYFKIKSRFDAACDYLRTQQTIVDQTKMAAIGYCFGGSMALIVAEMGAQLKGIVCFHGNLKGVSSSAEQIKAKILVCHGEADVFVPTSEVEEFKRQMDLYRVNYQLKIYKGCTHAFTNKNSDAVGKKYQMPIAYNEAGDKQSWLDMQAFLKECFK